MKYAEGVGLVPHLVIMFSLLQVTERINIIFIGILDVFCKTSLPMKGLVNTLTILNRYWIRILVFGGKSNGAER